MRRELQILAALILAAATSAPAATEPRPHTWQRWEHALTSAHQHENPTRT